MSYCFLSVGTVGAVRCVRTINSVKVFVEAYVTCNDAYTCAIPCAIVEVVSKNIESLLVVIAKYKISMCVSVSVPSFMSKAVNFVVNHVFDVVEWDKAAYTMKVMKPPGTYFLRKMEKNNFHLRGGRGSSP